MAKALVKKPERRIAQRLRPALGTVCQFDAEGKKGESQVGLVWNISLTGISMLLGKAPEPNAILTGELKHDSAAMPVILRVIQVRNVPTGDFILGAQFLRELTQEELTMFVDPHAVSEIG
jgi:hypothetical protein